MAGTTSTPNPRNRRHDPFVVAALLFISGGCALTYQITWLRELRLVFGYSTAASAAALAIFMGGLGVGAIVLGRRADSHRNPLRLYAQLELGIAALAAATLVLIAIVRWIYVAYGGSAQLGLLPATLLRLALSAAVLAAPTFLMGGTLSAAARSVEVSGEHRWRTALLYGSNTLGAVGGVLLANFALLELFGTRLALLLAAAANGLVALAAFSMAQPVVAPPRTVAAVPEAELDQGLRAFVLTAAVVAGFAFLLMEIVWYRMLSPLLGGSTYTFGVILAVALAGGGLGGWLYALEARRAVAFGAGRLAVISALEGLCCIIPFALGDRIALLAIRLQPTSVDSFFALMLIWVLLATIVVFPMALVSGYQFPLFIGLVGARAENVGAQVGRVYALNTIGAIVGSLAGGFGILPGLGALGAWRLGALSLGLLGLGGAAVAWRRGEGNGWIAGALLLSILGGVFCTASGPSAVWRHRPIGVIGLSASLGKSANEQKSYVHEVRRSVVWEEDGVESSVALTSDDAFSLFLNGKSDGNALGDASTMIMIGGLPAIFHEAPKRVLVIGLGLGPTAGFLATLPSVERVDVIELEPAVLRAARDTTPANFGVMENPKVHIVIGDAREFLLTTKNRYDIIASEPSNPYRAGVASLFTVEFYQAARAALAPNGIFAQWLQAYAVELPTIRTVLATVATVFDSVESWEVQLGNDLLLLAREHDADHDVTRLRARVDAEPYRTAMSLAWGVTGIEGLYSGFLASPALARDVRGTEPDGRLNTDDGTVIEFECARSISRPGAAVVRQLRSLVARKSEFAPPLVNGTVDVVGVAEARIARAIHEEKSFSAVEFTGPADSMARMEARVAYVGNKPGDAAVAWRKQPTPPSHPIDVLLLAHSLAMSGDDGALTLAETLRPISPGDADVVIALYHDSRGELDSATTSLAQAFRTYRTIPWGHRSLRLRALGLAWHLVRARPESVPPLRESLREPFAVQVVEDRRFYTNAAINLDMGPPDRCAEAIESVEPWVPWGEEYLRERLECYERVGSPYLQQARDDLEEFLAAEPAKRAGG